MYQSDLSNKEWALIEHHFKPEDPRGSAHKHSKKLIVDAILYVVKGGITWRMLPTIFLHGKPFTITLAAGTKGAFGIRANFS